MAKRVPLSRFENVALAFLVAGLVARTTSLLRHEMTWDGAWFAWMGRSLLARGEFRIPWENDAFTHYYPPFYPAVIALVLLLTRLPPWTASQLAGALSGAFLVAVAFLTTRSLYGRPRAFAVAALVACFPAFLDYEALGFSESLVAAFFTLTIWAIVKALDDGRTMVLAGLFAGLGYLTKSSMGYFFVIAGLAGLAWRFAYVRWRVFTDRGYLAGAAVFALLVAAWTARNVLHFGLAGWETQPWASESLGILWRSAGWPVTFAEKAAYAGLILLAIASPWFGGIARSLREWREERTSALLMAIALPTVIALFFITAFYYSEKRTLFDLDNKRYLVTSLVPLLWLGLRDAEFAAPPPDARDVRGLARTHAALLVAGGSLVALGLFLDPFDLAFTVPRFVALGAFLALGLALAAASLFFVSRVAERRKGSTVERSLVRAGVPAGAFVGAVGLAALGVGIALTIDVVLLFFLALGALAALAREPRLAVPLVALGLLATGLSGFHALQTDFTDLPYDQAMSAMVAARPHGLRVAGSGTVVVYLATLAPDDAKVFFRGNATSPDADFILELTDDANLAFPGFHLVDRPLYRHTLAPGAAAETWLEDRFFGGAPRAEPLVAYELFENDTLGGRA